MAATVPAAKQVRRGRLVPTQLLDVTIGLTPRPAEAGPLRAQMLDRVRIVRELAGPDRAVELSGVVAMMQPAVLPPSMEPWRTVPDDVRHPRRHVMWHRPGHHGEVGVEQSRRAA